MGTAMLIVSVDGTIKQEITLSGDRVTIGRRPYNDIVLDNPAISGEHALIVRSNSDCVLEDLGSTNGTYVNGQPVKKHFLQNNDVIELMKYRIKYIDALHADTSGKNAGMAATAQAKTHAGPPAIFPVRPGSLKVLDGSNANKELALINEITTLGQPGVLLAAIIRLPEGYTIRHVEGTESMQVNDHPISAEPFPLMDGDVINLSGTHILFSLI